MTKTPMQQCVQSAVLALLGMGEEGPTGSVDWLARVAEGGFLTLSGTERQRVAEDK